MTKNGNHHFFCLVTSLATTFKYIISINIAPRYTKESKAMKEGGQKKKKWKGEKGKCKAKGTKT